jgi:hypothetical protein
MKINIKNLGIFLVLLTITSTLLYVLTIYFDIQEGLTNNSPTAAPTSTEAKKPGVYVMTNTTYDSNGNVVVKQMDTSGNFSVNTYGSTIVNQTATQPPTTTTSQTAPQDTQYQPTTYSQPQVIPPRPSTTTTITANDVTQIATAAATAAVAAATATRA